MTLVSKATAGSVVAAIAVAVGASMSGQGQPAKPARPDYPVQPVPFTRVQLNDVFWAPRMETNRTASIPTAFQQCELTGRMIYFERAAKALRGEALTNKRPPGYPFDDTDVYKVIEGASYTLNVHPDPKLDAYVDGLIAKIAAAQEPDGYLYTTRTIDPKNPHRWAGRNAGRASATTATSSTTSGTSSKPRSRTTMATGKSTLLERRDPRGRSSRQDVRSRQALDLARPSDHRDGARPPVPRDRERAVPDLAKFLLDERGPGPASAGRADEPARPVLQPGAGEGHRSEPSRSATRSAPRTCTRGWPTSPR